MPGGDRTGPMGMGPRTGRAAGRCAGFGTPGYANPVTGRGFGRGCGRDSYGGLGRRNRCYATGLPGWVRFGANPNAHDRQTGFANADPAVEQQMLKQQADLLQEQLEQIKKRLDEIETAE